MCLILALRLLRLLLRPFRCIETIGFTDPRWVCSIGSADCSIITICLYAAIHSSLFNARHNDKFDFFILHLVEVL